MMEDIKNLREKTGAGMLECKDALKEANNDLEKAVEILRKKGISKAAKRSDRQANEGVIKTIISDDKKKAYILELNSETDFVARNEKFQEFADKLINLALKENVDSLEQLINLEIDGQTASDALKNLSGVIGEKLTISKLDSVSGQTVASYSHMGGKIAALVSLDSEGKDELALEIAMQVAASNPKYLNSQEVKEEEIAKEKEIYKEQLLKEGKPEQIIDKILEGKISKFFSEICLVNQEYIKDEKKSISDILGDVNVIDFKRYSLQ